MARKPVRRGQMGTFGGVFTPSILTILGLILFLRLGYVVGRVGLGQTVLIIVLASTIAILTSISLSAIATNLEVKGGGVYYIISRTLGVAFGGAIGLVLFVALAISAGFYCVGFAEGVADLIGTRDPLILQGVAALAVIAMFGVAWVGAAWATRFQYVVMTLLVAALISFGFGAWGLWSVPLLQHNFGGALDWNNFWVAFAIFFPAMTGFTQGVNMSGDLANPQRSIPIGTALAVALSILVYLGVALLFAGTVSQKALLVDTSAMRSVSAFAPMIDAGIIAATLSSALASLLGAPRILQSLARDRVFPILTPFAKGSGPADNPRRGIALAAAIALGVVALGNLNLIASVVSMFFVVTYGMLNYATYYEARARSPSFRPGLSWYDPRISLAGGIVALGVMLAINVVAGLAALAVVFGLFQYLNQSARAARWADGQRSYHLQFVRDHLLKASARPEHPRDWRPQILAFSDNAERRVPLLTFANWIEGHSGMTTVIRIIEGKGRHTRRAREKAEEELGDELVTRGLTAFPLVISAPDLDAAVPIAVQAAGIGPTRVNTVLVNWLRPQSQGIDTPEHRRFMRNLHSAFAMGCNLLVFDAQEADWERLAKQEPDERVIDIWWQNNRAGRLMLVLAYLLTRNDEWRGATIRLLAIAEDKDAEATKTRLEETLREVRIRGEVEIIAPVADSVAQMSAASADASLVFLGLGIKDERFIDAFGHELPELLPRLPTAVLTLAAEDVDLSADPDEGEERERAEAQDAIDAAKREAEKAAEGDESAEADNSEAPPTKSG